MGCGTSANNINPNEVDLSHFSVERVIGQGGFGKVNAVRKLQIGQRTDDPSAPWFAMKTLEKENVLQSKTGVDSVLTELQALVHLRHPFICNAHYAFQDEYHLYLVLDLALGGDLRFHLRRASKSNEPRFPESTARFFIAQVALALDYLHGQHFLHRDIKPDNIIMDATGYIKLTDFGVSKHVEDIEMCTATSGTHGYMAPEVYFVGHLHGTSAEWFSLGVVLYEFVFGHRPFSARRLCECREGVEYAKARLRLKELEAAEHISRKCKDFLTKMLCADPKSRLSGFAAVSSHPFLSELDWERLKAQEIEAPIKPDLNQANCDTGALDIEEAFGEEDRKVRKPISPLDQAKFERYRFNTAINPRRESTQHDLALTQTIGDEDANEDELYDASLRGTMAWNESVRISVSSIADAAVLNGIKAHRINANSISARTSSDPETPTAIALDTPPIQESEDQERDDEAAVVQQVQVHCTAEVEQAQVEVSLPVHHPAVVEQEQIRHPAMVEHVHVQPKVEQVQA